MVLKQAIIVLADISGYTNFLKLHTMSLLHAEKIVTDLMESIIAATSEPLRLNKLQGDAILFYAESGDSGSDNAKEITKQVSRFFETFSIRSRELTGCNNMCPCDACRQADQLRLKTVLHNGEIAVKTVAGFEELAGEPVILAHRLLKNSISSDEYILMTKSFAELSGGFSDKKAQMHSETYDDVGSIDVEVYYPDAREDLPPASRSVTKTLGQAWRLDFYSLLRVLGIKKAPPTAIEDKGVKPGFWSFAKDGIMGLAMLVWKK